MSVPAI